MEHPNKYQLKFHSYQDAKLLIEAIEKRYGGNKESKKVQRTLLKQQYENFAALSSELMDQTFDRNMLEIETINLDDLYNNLKIYEQEIIDGTAHGVSTTHSTTHTQGNGVNSICLDNLCDAMIYAFLASHPTLLNFLKKIWNNFILMI
ncbi:hypothetical protein Tco_1451194 [Tanacetum coccineum]